MFKRFAVCGNDVVVRNATIAAEVALFDEYFNDVSAAETDLLKQVGSIMIVLHSIYDYSSEMSVATLTLLI